MPRTSPAVLLALPGSRAQAPSRSVAQGSVVLPPAVGTPTTRSPVTCHQPSDRGSSGGQVLASDAGSGHTLPVPGLTRHWIRTEEVVCGVTEMKLGGSPGTGIQERRKRGLAVSACTWLLFWSQLPPGSGGEAGPGTRWWGGGGGGRLGKPASQHPCLRLPPFLYLSSTCGAQLPPRLDPDGCDKIMSCFCPYRPPAPSRPTQDIQRRLAIFGNAAWGAFLLSPIFSGLSLKERDHLLKVLKSERL